MHLYAIDILVSNGFLFLVVRPGAPFVAMPFAHQEPAVQQALWSTVRFAGVSDAVLKKATENRSRPRPLSPQRSANKHPVGTEYLYIPLYSILTTSYTLGR